VVAPSPPPADQSPVLRGGATAWWLGLVLAGAILLYLPTLGHEFVFDDIQLVTTNPAVQHLPQALGRLLRLDAAYRPVRTLSYAIDHAVGGMDPVIFRLSNLFYHALCLLVIWGVVRRVTGRAGVALAALSFFALHPVHVDAVVYIAGRRDLLASLFVLLAFWLYLLFQERRRWWYWPLLLLCFMLAFASKELGIVVPVLLLLYDWCRHTAAAAGSRPWWRRCLAGAGQTLRRGWWFHGPILLGAAGLAAYKLFWASPTGKIGWWGGNPWTNLLTVAKIICYELYLMALPLTLRADYSYDSFPVAYQALDPLGLAALALVAALVAWLVRRACRGDFQVPFWGGWFLVSLLPMSHIVPHHELFAEHYLYLASVGGCVLAALGLAALHRRFPASAWAAGAVWGLLLLSISLSHGQVYRDEVTLFRDVLAKAPRCLRANMAVGNYHFFRQQYRKALPYYEQILDVPPPFEQERLSVGELEKLRRLVGKPEGDYLHRDLGYYLIASRRLVQAYQHTGQSDQAKRVCREAIRFGVLRDMFQVELGNLYAGGGDFAAARDCFRQALQASPRDALIMANLAAAESELGRPDEAERLLRQAVEVKPRFAQAHYNLGLVLGRRNAPAEEIARHLQLAVQLGLASPELDNAREILKQLAGPEAGAAPR